MKIVLAGYNLDSSVIEDLRQSCPDRADITPETLSAAYARISRDARSVDKLRAVARAEVDKARRSNRTIIFKMGHHSVAEHAVFNFDVIGVSRLAMEEIEKFRLGSYTEKSQRYVKLEDDFLVPEEVKAIGQTHAFLSMVQEQNRMYHRLYTKLQPYFFAQYPTLAENPKRHAILDGWAKEDARYVVSLATLGQLGMTLNARNLEYMIRRFAAVPSAEIQEFNRCVFGLVKEVAPSIILFTEANDFDAKTYDQLAVAADEYFSADKPVDSIPVRLADYTPDADQKLIATLLHTVSAQPYAKCLNQAGTMKSSEKKELIKKALQHMEFYDAVLREFEYVDLTFELTVSATCFAQLKRHRMATLTSQPYNPDLGVVIPPSIEEVGEKDRFLEVINKSNSVYQELKAKMDVGAEYILTNAHQKRVLWKVNAREFYHFSRLREDGTAQWDIRNLAREMTQQALKVMPLSLLLIGGKDVYPDIYASVFGKSPRIRPPKL